MDTVAKKKPRPRRSFTPEFKADIVERCLAGDRTIAQVCRDFNLTEAAVRRWVEQATDSRNDGAGRLVSGRVSRSHHQ
jgi:transposase